MALGEPLWGTNESDCGQHHTAGVGGCRSTGVVDMEGQMSFFAYVGLYILALLAGVGAAMCLATLFPGRDK